MALTYGFYNSVEGDRKYDAIQMGQIFDGIITDGVYATFLKAMVVKASENASEVIVQPGRCWFNHTWTYIDADYPVEAPLPEVILDRVDALVIDINAENAFRENSLIWVQGTPSSLNPERPALIKSVTHNQYPLCYVYRKAGTTMIYAADITNAVGTSETPFVTGVLTGINIDDLLAQWDDEFHTWEAATKTSFEAWMVNQQSVYITWFDSIKDQMEGNLTDFEAWFETIRGIIDEEAATHLQAEIDALSEMLPAGSHIDISTSESTLFNRNVTVSDGVHSKTVQFDASGAATVESFPYIGIISVTSTDGTRTAEESINIPYFGRYSAVLAFWSATVNLVGDESLAALPVTVRDGNGDVVAIVTLNASGQGVFTATKPDTYKFIYTYGGQTMETTLQVTQETTYEVEIHGGFNYQAWLTAGRVSKTFSSLDDILADEKTLRQLMLVHDAVDYICNTFTTGSLADVTKIFNTDLAAKWINNSDYALDHFYAVPDIKSIMDTADKYGYGEWCLMPQVPTMTSNTAPYGEVIYSSLYSTSYAPWKAFDGVENNVDDNWASESNKNVGEYIGYNFNQNVVVTGIRIVQRATRYMKQAKLQGSNDGVEWEDITSSITVGNGTTNPIYIPISNTEAYSQIRLICTELGGDESGHNINVMSLQFYAWAPKGNVPVMTNALGTEPYGKSDASASASGYESYRAFDGNESTEWVSGKAGAYPQHIQYGFVNPICVKKFRVNFKSSVTSSTYIIQGSNDNSNYVDLSDSITDTTGIHEHDINNDNYYLYYRLKITAQTFGSSATVGQISSLQFYGRELKVSVPAMTSNTAPYGEVIYHEQNPSTSYYACKAFDNDDSTYWSTINTTTGYIGYIFPSNTVVKKVYIKNIAANDNPHIKNFTLQALNSNNEWVDTTETLTKTSGNAVADWYDIANDIPSKGHRLHIIDAYITTWMGIASLQFFGIDYSEKEFEFGTTKKWLYDHGVELEEVNLYKEGTATAIKNNDSIELNTLSNNLKAGFYCRSIDLTPYSLIRLVHGENVIGGWAAAYVDANWTSSNNPWNTTGFMKASKTTALTELPYNSFLNVQSVNETCGVGFNSGAAYIGKNNLTELWLE